MENAGISTLLHENSIQYHVTLESIGFIDYCENNFTVILLVSFLTIILSSAR